jgi:cation-transporting ATPase I
LVALVAAQLGQTMAVRGTTPLVIAAGVGSLAAMAAIVQIPGVSQFFGCSPLLPHQWGIALGAAGAATAVEVLSQASVSRRRNR